MYVSAIICVLLIIILYKHAYLFCKGSKINDAISVMYDGTQKIFIINNFDTAKKYHSIKTERTYKYLGYVFNKVLRRCIGTYTGKDWLNMKKPLACFFNTESVRNHFAMISKKSDEWLENFDSELKCNNDSKGIPLQKLRLDKLTISILSTIIYGRLSKELLDELYELSLLHNKIMCIMGTDMLLRCPFMQLFPSKNKNIVNEFWKKWNIFNDKFHPSVNQNNNHTLFNVMLEHEIYSNDKECFYHTLYEVMLFNLDIMIDSFANLVWNVATNNNCQIRILEEANRFDINTFEDIDNLEYTYNVINESARLNPGIVLTFAETLKNDAVIGGILMKKGDKITLNTRNINKDPKIWSNPDVFDPDRINQQNKYLFHRFGLGGRKCLGNVYANYILRIGITKLVKMYSFHHVNKLQKETRNTIINLNNYDMTNKIVFTKR
jgi:hypothetical protein